MCKYGYSYSIIVFVLYTIFPLESVSVDNGFIIRDSDIRVYETVKANALNSVFSGEEVDKFCRHLDNYLWYVQKDDLGNLLVNINDDSVNSRG
jgi:hypothetical protein